jgi:hypothetical protein
MQYPRRRPIASSVVSFWLVVEIKFVLFSEPRIVRVHLVDEIVIVATELHKGDGRTKVFAEFGISDIPR